MSIENKTANGSKLSLGQKIRIQTKSNSKFVNRNGDTKEFVNGEKVTPVKMYYTTAVQQLADCVVYLGTIHILRQQKDWVGGSRKWPFY